MLKSDFDGSSYFSYWLASVDYTNHIHCAYCNSDGYYYNRGKITRHWHGINGIRLVIILSSDVQITDSNGDGVFEIN